MGYDYLMAKYIENPSKLAPDFILIPQLTPVPIEHSNPNKSVPIKHIADME